MPNKNSSPLITPAEILKEWAVEREISISELGRLLGYQSNHMQLVLGPKQTRKVNFDLLGRVLYITGTEGPAIDMAQAMKEGE